MCAPSDLATVFRPLSWYEPKAPPLRVVLKRLFSAVSPSLEATTPSYPDHFAWIAAHGCHYGADGPCSTACKAVLWSPSLERRVEKRRIERELDLPRLGSVQLDPSTGETEVEHMPGVLSIGGQEMEMETGDVDTLQEGRAPETEQGALDRRVLKQGLLLGHLRQWPIRRRLSWHAANREVLEGAIHAHGIDQIPTRELRLQPGFERCVSLIGGWIEDLVGVEKGHGHERRPGVGRHASDLAIGGGLIDLSVQKDQFAVEGGEGTQTKIPVRQHLTELGQRLVDPGQQGIDSGDLIQRLAVVVGLHRTGDDERKQEPGSGHERFPDDDR